MDQTRLDAIRARCDAATPGPWELTKDGRYEDHDECRIDLPDDNIELCSYENGEFIAHSRADVPDMLAEIERLTAAIKLLESDRDAERKIRLDAEAEADAWRIRAEAAKKALEELMESAYNGDRGMCYMCNKEAACDQAIKDTKYAECVPEWRGPEEDKP